MQEREKGSVKQILQDLKMEIRSSHNTLLIAVDIGPLQGGPHCQDTELPCLRYREVSLC